MIPRRLGSTGYLLAPIGFGAFKIGRNEGIKYAQGYGLPDQRAVAALVDGLLGLGINWFDTAPAYGLSEERLGAALAGRRDAVVLSTKVGERFEGGRSHYDFSPAAITTSLESSLARLRTERVDLLFVHSDGRDVEILRGPTTEAMRTLQSRGLTRRIGFSGKTAEGFHLAMQSGYEVLMVEYHEADPSMAPVLEEAARRGIGVVVKKALASGRLDPRTAIPFALAGPGVASVALGGLRLEHFAEAVRLTEEADA